MSYYTDQKAKEIRAGIRRLHVIGEKPAEVPGSPGLKIFDSYIILNAPRPLFASEYQKRPLEWKGEFKHGVFYVGVDPADDRLLEINRAQDAWELHYWKREDALSWARSYYRREYSGNPGINIEEALENASEDDLIFTWHNEHNLKPYERGW